MSCEENKDLVRRYIRRLTRIRRVGWGVLDEYIAEGFVARNPLYPGVSLDREGTKQGRSLVAAPGSIILARKTRISREAG